MVVFVMVFWWWVVVEGEGFVGYEVGGGGFGGGVLGLGDVVMYYFGCVYCGGGFCFVWFGGVVLSCWWFGVLGFGIYMYV